MLLALSTPPRLAFITPRTFKLEIEVSALFYYLKWFSIQYEFLLLDVCLGRAICQHKTVKVLYFLYITESFSENWKSRKDFFFL